MHKAVKKQWILAWKDCRQLSFTIFVIFIVVTIMGVRTASYSSKVKLCDDYIPFIKVLKSNYILQEQVNRLTMELQQAQEKFNQDKYFISELQRTISEQQTFMLGHIEEQNRMKETILTLSEVFAKFQNLKISERELRKELSNIREDNL